MDAIVCIDGRNGIGRGGELLFHIPEDMAYFKAVTAGCAVIMGRKTLQSLPGGRPLPGRLNIVLSGSDSELPAGVVRVGNISGLAAVVGGERAFVIGGASVYAQLLSRCERAYVTEVAAEGDADCFFPDIKNMSGWHLAVLGEEREHNGLKFRFNIYENANVEML